MFCVIRQELPQTFHPVLYSTVQYASYEEFQNTLEHRFCYALMVPQGSYPPFRAVPDADTLDGRGESSGKLRGKLA